MAFLCVVNLLNHPNFGYNTNRDTQNNPFLLDLNINSSNFGRFTDAQGQRQVHARCGRMNPLGAFPSS